MTDPDLETAQQRLVTRVPVLRDTDLAGTLRDKLGAEDFGIADLIGLRFEASAPGEPYATIETKIAYFKPGTPGH